MDHDLIAEQEWIARNYRLAIQFSQYALARDPDHPTALRVLGLSLLKLGRVDEGVEALEHLSLLVPIDYATRIELAIGYGQIGRTELARDLLMRCAIDGNCGAVDLLRIAEGLEFAGEPRLAMEACRRAGRRSPEEPAVYYQMSHYARRCQYPVSVSEALLRRAIDLAPENAHYRIGLATLLIQLRRRPEAVSIMQGLEPSQIRPIRCECCLKRIANLFFDAGDLPRARQWAERLGSSARQHRSLNQPAADEPVEHRAVSRRS